MPNLTHCAECSNELKPGEENICVECREDNYVDSLMRMVPKGEDHLEVFEVDAHRMFKAGWSYDDARRMFFLHEEITPSLDEDYACTEMHKLFVKYGEQK